jgi:hypothetical protein
MITDNSDDDADIVITIYNSTYIYIIYTLAFNVEV